MSTTETNTELKTFNGKCHCGKIAFSFEHGSFETSPPLECNCSICKSRGYILVFPKAINFTSGSFENCTEYSFGKKALGHYFCPVCGSTILGKMFSKEGYAVNLRAVEGVDLAALKPTQYDGASL